MLSVGSRDMVWNGSAERTTGGLGREDLILNRTGMLVSKKASESASKRWARVRADRVRAMLPIIEPMHIIDDEETVELPIIERLNIYLSLNCLNIYLSLNQSTHPTH